MKPIFADTSYFIAPLSEDDDHHGPAVAWSEKHLGRLVVTEHVLVELGNALSRSKQRSSYVPFVKELLTDSGVLFIAASPALLHHGLALYAARPDQSWSVVDCISFVVMKRLREALTTDKHFIQAGYRALLREGQPP